jgi:hypothetical protein
VFFPFGNCVPAREEFIVNIRGRSRRDLKSFVCCFNLFVNSSEGN